MSLTCEAVQNNLSLFVYGDLSLNEEEKVRLHLESCAACQSALEKVHLIHQRLDEAEAMFDDRLLADSRRALRLKLAEEAAAPAPVGIWPRFRQWLNVSGAVWKPASVVALLAVGFLGGRVSEVKMAGLPAAAPEPIPVASKVRYVEPGASGNFQIALDETRQRVVTGNLEDPEIRQLLMTAAKDSSDPGLRAESVQALCARSQEGEVRDALLNALEHDSNAGVRLKALDGLKAYAKDKEARLVLTRVLLKDSNPSVRVQAIDVLTQVNSKDIVGSLQELLRREDNDYVRQRTQRVLSELRASPGIF